MNEDENGVNKGDPFGMQPSEWAGAIIIVLLIIFGVFYL